MEPTVAQFPGPPEAKNGKINGWHFVSRALVIGEQQPVVQVVVDNCGVPKSLVDRVAAQVERDLGIPTAHVVIASTHTHNAPSLTDYAPVVRAERVTCMSRLPTMLSRTSASVEILAATCSTD